MKPEYSFDTRAVHAGNPPDPATNARNTPIYQTSSYVFKSAEHAASLFALKSVGYIYSRLTNPTVAALEERLAALENGVGATAAASGHAAETMALFPLMSPGMELIASKQLYGGSINLMGRSYKRFGWNTIFVDGTKPEEFKKAITDKTRAIFIESLANPGGIVLDIEAISKIAQEAGIPLLVDNTMATPYLCKPLDWGADIVINSTTKFISGNGSSIGGAVIEAGRFPFAGNKKYPALSEPLPDYNGVVFAEAFGNIGYSIYNHAIGLRDLGAALAPMNAWITLMGSETLSLRMKKHSENALEVARYLKKHPKVAWVRYPGLEDDEFHNLANKYLPNGYGSVFTFGLKSGYEGGIKFVESLEMFSHVANIGDTRSLVIHPASTTHSQLEPAAKIAAGAGPEVVRLSIGIEDIKDIINDLETALDKS